MLAIWRPCLLYLAVVTVIAIPGVIATISYQPHGTPLAVSDYARHRDCGKEGQSCCGDLWSCEPELICERVVPHGKCEPCGDRDQPCCRHEKCHTGLVCNGQCTDFQHAWGVDKH